MFNIKYNIVNLAKVLLSILNMVLMLRVFGISQESDLYLLAYSIIYPFNFLPLLFMGQFMQFYNDLKAKSVAQAHAFYNQSVMFTALIGVVLFTLSYIFLQTLLHIHTVNIDLPRLMLLTKLMKIMVFCILFLPMYGLLERFFLAEKNFFMLYTSQIILILFPVLSLGYMMVTHRPNVVLLAGAYTVAVVVSVLLGLVVVAVKDIPFWFSLPKNFKTFVKNSFSTHLGITITNFFMPVILNNFLVNFPGGIISCFYYARNALSATNMIATDYSNRLILSEISYHISNENFSKIQQIIKKYLLYIPLGLGAISLGLYFFIPLGLKIIFMNTPLTMDGTLFQTLFLYLIPQSVLSLIAYPYYSVNISTKNGLSILLSNVLFVLALGVTLYICPQNIYYIAGALCLAQSVYLITCYIFYTTWRRICLPR